MEALLMFFKKIFHKNLPTDRKILEVIYEEYYDEFIKYNKDKEIRQTKNYVPIDILHISEKLKTDKDIIFARLYYYFKPKYSYKDHNGKYVYLFNKKLGNEKHCIHFPYSASILAKLRKKDYKI